jgi:mono/diheme cytochrome c family protein
VRRILLFAVLIALLLPGVTYGWNFYPQIWRVIRGPAARPLRSLSFEPTPARLARGRYLVRGPLNCARCHSDRDWSKPGAPPVDGKENAGHVYREEGYPWLVAPNLTPDVETGAGSWTDDMLARAIREGIGRDGRSLHPEMPYAALRYLTDEDVASVVVFLRSLPAVRNPLPRTRMPWRSRMRFTGLPQPITHPQTAPLAETERKGGYMAAVADCATCHTAARPGTEVGGKLFGGGNPFTSPLGTVFTANISPSPSGVGYYDEAMFVRVIRTGRVGARVLNPGMPWFWFQNLSDEDLKDVFAGLRRAKPVDHIVDNSEPPTWCRRCQQKHGGGARN